MNYQVVIKSSRNHPVCTICTMWTRGKKRNTKSQPQSRQKNVLLWSAKWPVFYTQLGSTQCIAFDKEYFLSFWHLLHPLLAIVYYTNWLALNMLVVLILHLAWGSSYLQDDPSSPFFIPWSTFFPWHDFGGFHLHTANVYRGLQGDQGVFLQNLQGKPMITIGFPWNL